MRQLLEDYKRRLKTVNEELKITIDEAVDIDKITRLTIKRGCYRTFITELERIAPPVKPIDPKILQEEQRIEEEKNRKEQEKQDAFNKMILESDTEEKVPDGF
jgi:hypothetical protein